MAAILPDRQKFVELVPGTTVGIHLVTLTSDQVATNDTFEVPILAQTGASGSNGPTDSVSSGILRRVDGNTATVADDASSDDGNTITITAGTAGQQIVVVTIHGAEVGNSGDETSTVDPF